MKRGVPYALLWWVQSTNCQSTYDTNVQLTLEESKGGMTPQANISLS